MSKFWTIWLCSILIPCMLSVKRYKCPKRNFIHSIKRLSVLKYMYWFHYITLIVHLRILLFYCVVNNFSCSKSVMKWCLTFSQCSCFTWFLWQLWDSTAVMEMTVKPEPMNHLTGHQMGLVFTSRMTSEYSFYIFQGLSESNLSS